MIMPSRAMAVRGLSSLVIWSSGSACTRPRKKINAAHSHHPLQNNPMPSRKIKMKGRSRRTRRPSKTYITCPPSNCPAGIKFKAVTSKPAQPAQAMGCKIISRPPIGSGRLVKKYRTQYAAGGRAPNEDGAGNSSP